MTTTNGTRALLAAHQADSIAVLALVNLTAAVDWAARQERRIVILCAGDRGAAALEDTVCAGLAARRLAARVNATLGREALLAVESAAPYAQAVGALRATSPWARVLDERGLADDVEACLTTDAFDVVPVYHPAHRIVTR
jgi:2-phosphosulfolactate phosphatase